MSAQRKILVVDDDPVIGQSINRVLKTKGYAVVTASSGYEAINKIKNEQYDAVFTDLKMPGMSGLELASVIKKNQSWMPVVIITGYGSEAYEKTAKDMGVSDFLRKPLSPEMIESMAAKATDPAVELVAEVEQEKTSFTKNVLLFLVSPFIGLAYVIATPFVGIGALVYFSGKALMSKA